MTGIFQALLASGGSIVPLTNMTASDTQSFPVPASASISFSSTGVISYTGNASSGPVSWFLPHTIGVGNQYWIKLTVNSGTGPTSGTAGSVLALSAGQIWTWLKNTLGAITANCTITLYSDAGGASPVTSGTLSVVSDSS